ncbi:hypothetical protein OEZ85_004501 [Tetradesmus obliquus]|uniref:Amidohydrolase-related domain-containing protein n=1 Tax=Tetradesmus obliquus TaxID=3088 RepID=A0ABY8ULN5_TETOB|nr:hypothetical protein OEZ85_004501 [Tetradesmus obliquus]
MIGDAHTSKRLRKAAIVGAIALFMFAIGIDPAGPDDMLTAIRTRRRRRPGHGPRAPRSYYKAPKSGTFNHGGVAFKPVVIPVVFHCQRFMQGDVLQPPIWKPQEAGQNLIDVTNKLYKGTGIQFKLQEVRSDVKQHPYLLLSTLDDWQSCTGNPSQEAAGFPCLQVGQAMYKKAGELGLPVGHMPFKGLLLHIDEIEHLLQQYPATKAIIDHMGFCKCDNLQSEEWQRLLGLAKYPQVYVKASAFFRVSAQQQYPYADTCAGLKALVDAFGAQRVMWGSDFPWITSVEGFGYVKGWQLLDDVEAATGEQLLTQEQRQWVFGGTIASLFPGSWQQRSS